MDIAELRRIWLENKGNSSKISKLFGNCQPEQIILFGQPSYTSPDKLNERAIGYLHGIAPGMVLLKEFDRKLTTRYERLLSGFIVPDAGNVQHQYLPYRYVHLVESEIWHAPYILLKLNDSAQYPVELYYDTGGGGKESLFYLHLLMSAERWDITFNFLKRWLEA